MKTEDDEHSATVKYSEEWLSGYFNNSKLLERAKAKRGRITSAYGDYVRVMWNGHVSTVRYHKKFIIHE